MIRYDRLWDTMASRGMTQYKLIKFHSFSAGQIGRLKKNMHVSTHTLETLCRLLDCRIEDIVEYAADAAAQTAVSDSPMEQTSSDPLVLPEAADSQMQPDAAAPHSQSPAPDTQAVSTAVTAQLQDSILPPSDRSAKAGKTKKGSKAKKASKKSPKNAKKSRKK